MGPWTGPQEHRRCTDGRKGRGRSIWGGGERKKKHIGTIPDQYTMSCPGGRGIETFQEQN